jgi:hypothetical protein
MRLLPFWKPLHDPFLLGAFREKTFNVDFVGARGSPVLRTFAMSDPQTVVQVAAQRAGESYLDT